MAWYKKWLEWSYLQPSRDPLILEVVTGVAVVEEENGSRNGAQQDSNNNKSDEEEDNNENKILFDQEV